MPAAPKPATETQRLAALRAYDILDTDPESDFDDLALIAASICQTPIALVSLVDEQRQWFKARVGLEPQETHRDLAFCAYAIHQNEVMVVADTHLDPRFDDNPLVNGPPHIRFYAGAPLTTPAGDNLGTLCVIDSKPRTLSDAQRDTLAALSRQVVNQLELRRTNTLLNDTSHSKSQLLALLSRDMRSALQVMAGYASRLDKNSATISGAELLDIAGALRRASEHTDQLLDNLVEWSRLDAPPDASVVREVELNAMFQDCVNAAAPQIAAKSLEVFIDAEPALVVNTAPLRLRALLRNLLDNTIKYSHPGGRIELSARAAPDHTVVSVRDHGIGMNEGQLARLFTDLAEAGRAPREGTAGERGAGLGARLAWRLAQRLNAGLTVDAAPDQGTTVTLRLPR